METMKFVKRYLTFPMQEFRVLMGALGENLSESKIDELLNEIDKDKSGTIDCEEFLHFMHLYSFLHCIE